MYRGRVCVMFEHCHRMNRFDCTKTTAYLCSSNWVPEMGQRSLHWIASYHDFCLLLLPSCTRNHHMLHRLFCCMAFCKFAKVSKRADVATYRCMYVRIVDRAGIFNGTLLCSSLGILLFIFFFLVCLSIGEHWHGTQMSKMLKVLFFLWKFHVTLFICWLVRCTQCTDRSSIVSIIVWKRCINVLNAACF